MVKSQNIITQSAELVTKLIDQDQWEPFLSVRPITLNQLGSLFESGGQFHGGVPPVYCDSRIQFKAEATGMIPPWLSRSSFCNLQDCLDLPEGSPPASLDYQADPKLRKTSQDEGSIPEAHILPLPPRSERKHLQPSFQKQFLKEHNSVFHQQFQNFLEPILQTGSLDTAHARSHSRERLFDHGHTFTLRGLLNEGSVSLPEQQLINLKADLRRMADLEQWLDHLGTECTKPLMAELVRVSLDIWWEVRHINFKYQQGAQLLERAEAWSRSHSAVYFRREDFRYINLRVLAESQSPHSSELQRGFQSFLRSFAITALFLLGGFFQNPCLKPNGETRVIRGIDYPKRQSSVGGHEAESPEEEGDSASFSPRKQLKQ